MSTTCTKFKNKPRMPKAKIKSQNLPDKKFSV